MILNIKDYHKEKPDYADLSRKIFLFQKDAFDQLWGNNLTIRDFIKREEWKWHGEQQLYWAEEIIEKDDI